MAVDYLPTEGQWVPTRNLPVRQISEENSNPADGPRLVASVFLRVIFFFFSFGGSVFPRPRESKGSSAVQISPCPDLTPSCRDDGVEPRRAAGEAVWADDVWYQGAGPLGYVDLGWLIVGCAARSILFEHTSVMSGYVCYTKYPRSAQLPSRLDLL